MSVFIPPCRAIEIAAFQGDRTKAASADFLARMRNAKAGISPEPTLSDCLIHAGHAGISLDDGATYFGFNPRVGSLPIPRILDDLKSGLSFPGTVTDDTSVFRIAESRGIEIRAVRIVLPAPRFEHFQTVLDSETEASQYTYGFANSEGDCNCVTWIERIGLPLLTGRMSEYMRLTNSTRIGQRRFGKCD